MDKEYTAEVTVEDSDTGAVAEITMTVYAENKRKAVSAFAALFRQIGAMKSEDVREQTVASED